MNHHAGIFKGNSKTSNSSISLLGLLCLFFYIQFGSCPPGGGIFDANEAGRANSCGVVGCFEGREAAIARGRTIEPVAARPPKALSTADRLRRLTNNRGRRKPSFSSLFASQTTRAPPRSRLLSELRSLYPSRCGPRGASGLRQPTQKTPRGIAS